MEAEELVAGQQVKPLQRTIRTGVVPATHSPIWRQALERHQNFLYVLKFFWDAPDGIPRVFCTLENPLPIPPLMIPVDHLDGDWFQDVDLVEAK